MLHEDFLHQQSMVARAYYRSTDSQPTWWEPEEFLRPMATTDVYADLFGALRGRRYVAVASALGWMEYLRAARQARRPPRPRGEHVKAYRRLGTARYALATLGRFRYREHDHNEMRGYADASDELKFPRADAKKNLNTLRTGKVTAERPTPATELKEDSAKPKSGA